MGVLGSELAGPRAPILLKGGDFCGQCVRNMMTGKMGGGINKMCIGKMGIRKKGFYQEFIVRRLHNKLAEKKLSCLKKTKNYQDAQSAEANPIALH